MTTIELTTTEALAILKKDWPAIRRTASTALVHSGASQAVFRCLCGSRHTASNKFANRHAKHVGEWAAEHADCAAKLAARHLAGEEIKVYFGR